INKSQFVFLFYKMTFIENSIYFLIIFLNIFSQIIFCSNEELNQKEVLSEITPSRMIGGYRLNELLRTVTSYDGKLAYTKYLVSLRKEEDDTSFGYNHICGGAILNEYLILTAAHCLVQNDGKIPVSSLRVVAKTPLRLQSNLDTQILKVKKAVMHSKFSSSSTHNDIALLKLSNPIELDNKWAAAISLPEKRIDDKSVCIVLGWGKLYLHGPLANQVLYLNVTLLSKNLCKQLIHNFGDAKLCAFGTYDSNPCSGDSGGPLICDGVLAGIVSYGNQLCIGMPTVYTEVYRYKNWIEINGASILDFNSENMPFKIVLLLIIMIII
ncbi:hypothetical protein DOY81_004571, partial [Sarcophaga bullata]